jgi:hypothetical protein
MVDRDCGKVTIPYLNMVIWAYNPDAVEKKNH